ncbi:MAG: hypothetical protein KDI48_12240 [Xanthomonadales bacterium]|nr:hypothetical protein [Xanthomonadales bacterium]
MNAPQTSWLRARIVGHLEVLAPLHVGSGDVIETSRMSKEEQGNETALANALCRTAGGRPYLPAATLRGALRARLNDASREAVLFGTAHDDNGRMGKLRFYDAVQTEDTAPKLRSGTAIDPLLGVVAAHKLFVHEVVLPGCQFDLTIEADRLDSDELAAVLGLLDTFADRSGRGIGAGKSKDQGLLNWQLDRVEVIDEAALSGWLNEMAPTALPWTTLQPVPAAVPCADADLPSVDFSITFHTPWLVDAPELHRAKINETDHPPDLEFSRLADGRAWLPASSLKGWLRGRARRVLITLYVGHGWGPELAGNNADKLLSEIFGTTDQASWLLVSDAFFSDKDIPSGHLQQFVAIDRFTGGSSEGALYKVHAAPPCVVRGRISWRTAPDPDGDWRLALLAMLARDAMEGDLIVGWGKARGYGQGVAGLRLPAQPAGSDSDLDWPTLATWLGEGRQLDPHLRTFRAIFQPTAEEACHD